MFSQKLILCFNSCIVLMQIKSLEKSKKWFRFPELFRKIRPNVSSNHNIRQMEKKDIKSALSCVESLGLTESPSTLEAVYECDPKAFYVAINGVDKRVIGVCGAPVLSHSTGFFGLYGVDKSFQNLGIGRQLFDLCLKHVGDRNGGLHAVRHKLYLYQDLYEFRVKSMSSLNIFAGIPKHMENINVLIDENHEIKEFKSEDKYLLSKLIEFDAKVHNESRDKLLELTLSQLNYKTFVFTDRVSDQVLGFGCVRHNINGIALMGPVYADNDYVAEILVYNLIKSSEQSLKNGLLYPTLDLCESSHRIARKLGLNRCDTCLTIFTKHTLLINHKYMYCLYSPNFGF